MIKSQRKILKEYIKLNKNRICELLGIKYPILQGGMAWVADAKGLGIIVGMNLNKEELRSEINKY